MLRSDSDEDLDQWDDHRRSPRPTRRQAREATAVVGNESGSFSAVRHFSRTLLFSVAIFATIHVFTNPQTQARLFSGGGGDDQPPSTHSLRANEMVAVNVSVDPAPVIISTAHLVKEEEEKSEPRRLDCDILAMTFEKHCHVKPSAELLNACKTKEYYIPELNNEANEKCKESSLPFVSIDLFYNHADVVISTGDSIATVEQKLDEKCNKRDEADGACLIYINTRDIYSLTHGAALFLRWLIKPFSLISSLNDDECMPYHTHPRSDGGQPFSDIDILMQSPLLRRWYVKNLCIQPEHYGGKLVAVPLGPKWQWSSREPNGEDKAPTKQKIMDAGAADPRALFTSPDRTHSIYIAMSPSTTNGPFQHSNKDMRAVAIQHLKSIFTGSPTANSEDFYFSEENADHAAYMMHMAKHGMVLSPPGQYS